MGAAPWVFLGGVALGEEVLLPEGCIVVKAQLGIGCYELAILGLCQRVDLLSMICSARLPCDQCMEAGILDSINLNITLTDLAAGL